MSEMSTPERSASAVPLAARMVDIAFALEGDELPREHLRVLADALEQALPWLAGLQGAGIHRLKLSVGGGPAGLLSGRTRLTLRLPRERAADAAALAGAELQLGRHRLRVGAPRLRELLPHGTLYAQLVCADDSDDGDEGAFMRAVDAELSALGVPCRPICGRRQVLESGAVQGFSLMLDGLTPAHSLRVLEAGLGAQRRLGCGLFVPHRSAAAVGTPA
jgi:CRISPR-associated protein Cas6